VHYFVSYYDYYLPEAYIPQTDTYIEKDAKINDVIDRLRHATTQDVLTRRDIVVIASVSCIYGIGDPAEYRNCALQLAVDQTRSRREILDHLALLQYERRESNFLPGSFRVRGDIIEIYPVTSRDVIRISLHHNAIEQIQRIAIDASGVPVGSGETIKDSLIFPAKHFVTPHEKLAAAMRLIERELAGRLRALRANQKLLEAERLEQRTRYDLEMLRELGYCAGIENYSRHLTFRREGEPPWTLLDYFPRDCITFIDESHMTIPQIRGMYAGDRARKEVLVEFGFRLPSALDNRPLTLEEFESRVGQVLFVSATPGTYERARSRGPHTHAPRIVEQLLRPTGLLDPDIAIHPSDGQLEHFIGELRTRIERGERTLALVLTKRLAEDLAGYLKSRGFRVAYLHSEIHTLKRPAVLHDLRSGTYDILVGVNLLREGLDLPEVSLVAVFDADKEGFLRNETTLIQMMGRAARHIKGTVILYASTVTNSMKRAISEVERRRAHQRAYNEKYRITPKTIERRIRELPPWLQDTPPSPARGRASVKESSFSSLRDPDQRRRAIRREMRRAALNLEFEYAAHLRDLLQDLRK
ncbi:MAG: excinuclease ABC subunit UvrB, partial [Parcubacteria group bacterium]|nr:excinuclease ABC subunit UvrB [Parcubacteria group bacterium]